MIKIFIRILLIHYSNIQSSITVNCKKIMINLILINKFVHYSKEKKYSLGNLSFSGENLWDMVFLGLNYYEI